MKKFYKIRNDSVFKIIFSKKENWHLLEKLIKEVINEDVEIESVTIPELTKDKPTAKRMTLDVLVKVKNEKINIEINSDTNEYLRRRNYCYINKIYTDSLRAGEKYQDMPRCIQINFTVYKDNSNKRLWTKYGMLAYNENLYNEIDGSYDYEFIDNLVIYEINITKAAKLWYNGDTGSLLSMLDMDYEQIINVEGDKDMEKLKEEVIELNDDQELVKLFSDEEEEKFLINTMKQIGYDDGIEKGFEKGIEENTIEMVKKMLEKNMDLSLISDITGLSKEKIKNLSKKEEA